MKFQDIMAVMGKTEPEMSGSEGNGTNYRIAYEIDGLTLEFISDYADGHALIFILRKTGRWERKTGNERMRSGRIDANLGTYWALKAILDF